MGRFSIRKPPVPLPLLAPVEGWLNIPEIELDIESEGPNEFGSCEKRKKNSFKKI